MFAGESPTKTGDEKEDGKQEQGFKDGGKGKETTKDQKRDVRGWKN